MPSVDIIDLNNKVVGSIELSDAVFGAPVNENLLYEAVRHHLAGTRRGTASTKTRHEVAGSGKEIVEAEGHGARSYGFDPQPAVAAWWDDAWSATTGLFVSSAEEDAVGCVEERAICEIA